MISFSKYIEKTFYNEIYEASENYFLDHLEDLGITNNYDGEVEVIDVEVRNVYAGHRGDGEIDIDILTNVYATVSETTYYREDEVEKNRWLRVSCAGKPDAGIKNFRVAKVDAYEKGTFSTFKYPLSDKLVPFIWKDDLDKVAKAILKKYEPNALLTPIRIEPETIVKQMGLQIKYETITSDNSIFGQIYFQDNLENGIPAGTVVIEEKLSQLRNAGVVRNTIIHECVHWELHRYALELARAEKEELSVLSTTEDIKKEGSSDMISWMEWHAESIAPKILMPKEMFVQEARVRQQRLLEFSETQDELEIVEKWIDELALFFGVSRLSAKVRLAECGFDLVKGTFIYLDDKYVPTHKWKNGYLEDTQTFSINLIQLGLQLLSQPNLKERVDKGELLCVESHLCINDAKYISYDIAGNPFLTLYARHHMDECCIVFNIVPINRTGNSTTLTLLLNRDADSDIQFTISYPKDKNEWIEQVDVHIGDTLEIMSKLNGMSSFAPALVEVMKWRDVRNQELADASNLGLKAISNLRNGKTEPKLESAIAICVGMKLPPIVSKKLVELSGNVLRTGNPKDMLYEFILCGTASLDVNMCNTLLVNNGFKELVPDRSAL
ncbi:ImmA/IrrE family metallo-endopeptidase [Streptococcus mutans]|uniref:ImmA/IrrE family metallo-endopeptidase n=1 Tax=Streptococcus mutans TaxID=1309 RepID=UPI0014552D3E|nr:ImmA/IrrE family metallo-endopeptidase [Streptococcus mutans]MDO8139818.1 ImmA/IrrE family metallo-endopeptidase [Streptococcus mutans]NLQ36925.1 ImmA/IrrE family metallo-endopeptidase [Streptococcus mutans]